MTFVCQDLFRNTLSYNIGQLLRIQLNRKITLSTLAHVSLY